MNLKAGTLTLFIGDSITDAFRKPDELNDAYRLGNGWVLMAAAELLASRPDEGLRFENRGVSGNTIEDMAARWDADCLDRSPDVVSVLIGVNDSLRGRTAGQSDESACAMFGQTYSRLLSTAHGRRQSTSFVVCEPFLLAVGEITREQQRFMRVIQGQARSAAHGAAAQFVPLQKVFDAACSRAPAAHWSYDGIHPTAAGFRLIASAWLAAVTEAGT